MNNIIIVGDSFCSSAEGWPSMLAEQLKLNLISHGIGGQPWWDAREFLISLPKDAVDNAEFMIFVHTNSDRIPTVNKTIGQIDHSNLGSSEIEQAVKLYFKYIHDHKFLIWAQQQWFQDINKSWGHKKICHLHSFPWSTAMPESGINVVTPLAALSLNELGKTSFDLFNDNRANHFSTANNQTLANELAHLINNYCPGNVALDHTKFEQRVLHWLDWK